MLVVGDRKVALTGRAASIAALVAKHQDQVNRMPLGKLEISFSPGGIVITLQESLERVKLT